MAPFSPKFLIGTLRIGSIEEASCLNMGNNWPIGFESYKKHNQGFGSITGDHNDLEAIESKLSDSKIIDMLFHDSEDDEIPEWVKEIMIKKLNESEIEE